MKAATVSYHGMMAGILATAQANVSQGKHFTTTDDPAFAAIARHREAVQALTTAHKLPDELVTQLLGAEVDDVVEGHGVGHEGFVEGVGV